jgi:ABC-2 type transport system permease protein
MTIASAGWGAAAVGGDEESGQLELTVAHGVTRIQVVLERALSLFLRVVLHAVLLGCGGLASGPFGGSGGCGRILR